MNDKEEKRAVHIQMPKAKVDALQEQAKSKGLTLTAYIRFIIYNHEKERQS